MTKKPLESVLQYLRRVALNGHGGASDAYLLERFVRQRDEAAFERLIALHGPMVLGLCQRLLRHEQDSEDAFQATFAILARKAATISCKESLGSWLYKVAYRVACRARGGELTNRMAVLDQTVAKSEADAMGTATHGILHEEIARLTDAYRGPIVLCYLQGKTNEEAARLLGCPRGTVASRLSRAKEQLRRRLSRRGWTLSTGAVASVLTDKALAVSLPAGLVRSTLAYVAGTTANAGSLSAKVLALSEGVLHMLWLDKMKMAAGVVFALVLAGTGVGLVARQTWADGGTGNGQAGEAQAVAGGQKANPFQRASTSDRETEFYNLRKEMDTLNRKLDSALKDIQKLHDLLATSGAKTTAPATSHPPPTESAVVPMTRVNKNSIESLFDGIPADLGSKVIGNRVRRDRVNEWLQQNVNGKEKIIQLQGSLNVSIPRRADDGTYWTDLRLNHALVKVLGDTWNFSAFGANVREKIYRQLPDFGGSGPSFEFEGVSAADAEKLADLTGATIQGKVKEAKLESLTPDDLPPYGIQLILDDVLINGQRFAPRKAKTPANKRKGGFGGPPPP